MIFIAALKPGDTVLIPDTVYPPVRSLCKSNLEPRGIRHIVYDPMIGGEVANLMDGDTKLLWTESPSSTTMEFQDIAAMTAAAAMSIALSLDSSTLSCFCGTRSFDQTPQPDSRSQMAAVAPRRPITLVGQSGLHPQDQSNCHHDGRPSAAQNM